MAPVRPVVLALVALLALPALADEKDALFKAATPQALYERARQCFSAGDWAGFLALWSPASRKAADEMRLHAIADGEHRRWLGAPSVPEAKAIPLAAWCARVGWASERQLGGPFGPTAALGEVMTGEAQATLKVTWKGGLPPQERSQVVHAVKVGGAWWLRAAGAGPEDAAGEGGPHTEATVKKALHDLVLSRLKREMEKELARRPEKKDEFDRRLKEVEETFGGLLDQVYDRKVREQMAAALSAPAADREKRATELHQQFNEGMKELQEKGVELPIVLVVLIREVDEDRRAGRRAEILNLMAARKMMDWVLREAEKRAKETEKKEPEKK